MVAETDVNNELSVLQKVTDIFKDLEAGIISSGKQKVMGYKGDGVGVW